MDDGCIGRVLGGERAGAIPWSELERTMRPLAVVGR
jgi:hypothetical protein